MFELLYYLVMTVVFATGTVGAVREVLMLRRAARGEGVVVALREVEFSDGGTGFSAVVRFDAGGRSWEITDRMVNRPAAHTVGQRVTVYYPPGDPSQGRLRHTWVLPLCLVVAGVSGLWLAYAVASAVGP